MRPYILSRSRYLKLHTKTKLWVYTVKLILCVSLPRYQHFLNDIGIYI
jgi:hypothetical protein